MSMDSPGDMLKTYTRGDSEVPYFCNNHIICHLNFFKPILFNVSYMPSRLFIREL
jgi:hypothetical protein